MPPRRSKSNRKDKSTHPTAPVKKPPKYIISEELYRIQEPTGKAAEKKVVKTISEYETFLKWAAKTFPGAKKPFQMTKDYELALEFLGWKIKPEEISAGIYAARMISAVIALVLVGIGFINFGLQMATFGFAIFGVVLVLIAPSMVKNMPLSAAQDQKFKTLVEIPKIIGYLVMSMKLSPNLERAISFAAEHGEGKLADSLRDLLWNVNVGVYANFEEGLDDLAYTWGSYSPEFKQSMMTIRSSVLEPNETKRFLLYDSALNDVLHGIGNQMSDYARDLKSPAMYMFYLGVLLPLILIIVLPVGSVFSNLPFANPLVLGGLYAVGLPLMLYFYATALLDKRPPTYVAPEIPDNYPGLPKPGNFFFGGKSQMSIKALIAIILIVGLSISFVASTLFDPTEANVISENFGGVTVEDFKANRNQEDIDRLLKPFDFTPLILISGVLFSVSLAIAAFLYFSNVYKYKIQLDIAKMEDEFKDSTYLLASRLGQNKPIEDAIKYVGEFIPDSTLSRDVLGKIRQNIALLGLTLEGAVFDKTYGALTHNPSNLLKTSFRIIIDSVNLGVNVAARSIMSLSSQLQAFDSIDREIKVELSEITGTMTSMATFIAPLVLGITTALQKVVIGTLGSFSSQDAASSVPQGVVGVGGFGSGGGFGDIFQAEALDSAAGPAEFTIILAIYIIELVIIMIWFGESIKSGKNNLGAWVRVAQSLPIAIALFLIAAFMAKGLAGAGL